jgi:hypothetical protein
MTPLVMSELKSKLIKGRNAPHDKSLSQMRQTTELASISFLRLLRLSSHLHSLSFSVSTCNLLTLSLGLVCKREHALQEIFKKKITTLTYIRKIDKIYTCIRFSNVICSNQNFKVENFFC